MIGIGWANLYYAIIEKNNDKQPKNINDNQLKNINDKQLKNINDNKNQNN